MVSYEMRVVGMRSSDTDGKKQFLKQQRSSAKKYKLKGMLGLQIIWIVYKILFVQTHSVDRSRH